MGPCAESGVLAGNLLIYMHILFYFMLLHVKTMREEGFYNLALVLGRESRGGGALRGPCAGDRWTSR